MDVAKREDALLDTISELVRRRDRALLLIRRAGLEAPADVADLMAELELALTTPAEAPAVPEPVGA